MRRGVRLQRLQAFVSTPRLPRSISPDLSRRWSSGIQNALLSAHGACAGVAVVAPSAARQADDRVRLWIGRTNPEVLAEFQQQSGLAVRAAELLCDLVDKFTSVQAKAAVIADAEREGDDVTHNIVRGLNRAPNDVFDREDLHRLAMRLDDVLDGIDAVAERLVVYGVGVPTSACRAMADVVAATVRAMDRAVGCLRTLDHSFAEHAIEVNRLENVADVLLRRSAAELFETRRNPLDVLKWKEIYETLERVTDRCEDATNVMEGLILKQA